MIQAERNAEDSSIDCRLKRSGEKGFQSRRDAHIAKIKALPENKWTPLPSEKEIRARTWSSCTFDSKRRELIYWGGGHSGNVNSNVDHFSMRTGRWSRNLDSTWKPSPFGAMAACPKGRTYYDEPWTMHARKT